MPTKVKELDNTKDGDRNACSICRPPESSKRVPAWKVWHATLRYGGRSHR